MHAKAYAHIKRDSHKMRIYQTNGASESGRKRVCIGLDGNGYGIEGWKERRMLKHDVVCIFSLFYVYRQSTCSRINYHWNSNTQTEWKREREGCRENAIGKFMV